MSVQAPPRSIKLKKGKGYSSKKKKDTGEEVTVEGTPRTPITQKEEQAKSDEGKKTRKNSIQKYNRNTFYLLSVYLVIRSVIFRKSLKEITILLHCTNNEFLWVSKSLIF